MARALDSRIEQAKKLFLSGKKLVEIARLRMIHKLPLAPRLRIVKHAFTRYYFIWFGYGFIIGYYIAFILHCQRNYGNIGIHFLRRQLHEQNNRDYQA